MGVYNVDLKTLPQEGLSESEFYVDLDYQFRQIASTPDFNVTVCMKSGKTTIT